MENIEVKSLTDYIKLLNDLDIPHNENVAKESKKSVAKPLTFYRGQSDYDWNIVAGCNRRLNINVCKEENFQTIINYHQELLLQVRKRIPFDKELSKLNDIDLLSEIQHFGGATCLIDFTLNPLVALFFACQSNNNKDGVVICLRNDEKLRVKPFSDCKNKEIEGILKETIDSELDIKHWGRIWYPTSNNHRILQQSSVFYINYYGVVEKERFFKVFKILNSNKSNILKELDIVANLNAETIYPDFLGFIVNNHSKQINL